MNQYDKCRFCLNFDDWEGCENPYGDSGSHECFKANKSKIIETSREQGISVADLVALISLK